MKPLCVCGCRREARTQWHHPRFGVFQFAALCSIRLGPALESQGWQDVSTLAERQEAVSR